MKTILAVTLALVVVRILSGTAHASKHQFDLEGGNAAWRLNEWSEQSEKEILFDYQLLATQQTCPVHGYMEDATALRLMLQGTAFTADPVNTRAWAAAVRQECEPRLGAQAPTPPCGVDPELHAWAERELRESLKLL